MPTVATDPVVAAALFHALSDPIRIEVLRLLGSGERCVCELMDDLGLAQSRLSWHLKTLKDAGLISDRRDGRWSYYALQREAFELAETTIAALKPRVRRLTIRAANGACSQAI